MPRAPVSHSCPPLLRDCALQQIHAERYATMRTDAGCLPREVQIVALVGLFSALEYLADVPMIHRDVKPVRPGPVTTSPRPPPPTAHTRTSACPNWHQLCRCPGRIRRTSWRW